MARQSKRTWEGSTASSSKVSGGTSWASVVPPAPRTELEPVSGTPSGLGHDFGKLSLLPPVGGSGCEARAPTGLESALRGHQGQPLPPALRADAERRFGGSLASVKLHDGPEAHRLARAAGARAFTSGRDVVFRAGQYAPQTPAGRELLWHELAHAAGAPRSPAVVLRAPLFDLTEYTSSPLPPGHTVASTRALLDARIKKGDILSATVSGAGTSVDALIFLQYFLWQMSRRDRWDTVLTQSVPLGWPPPPGSTTPSPRGLVRVAIDATGNARIELLSRAAVPPSPQLADPVVNAHLTTTFGLKVVNGDSTWTAAHLSDVAAALALLPATDVAALKDVDLVRMQALPNGRAGEFSRGGAVPQGSTAPPSRATLKLADGAFAANTRFLGEAATPRPASYGTILHEVGHAVEVQVARPLHARHAEAVVDQNKAVAALNPTVERYERARVAGRQSETQSLRPTVVAQRATYDRALRTVRTRQTALDAVQVPAATIALLKTALSTQRTQAQAELTTATTAAAAFAPADQTESAAFRSAITATVAALDAYVAQAPASSDLDALDKTLLAAFSARTAARDALRTANAANPALVTYASVLTSQDAWREAARELAHTRGRSLRLQRFVDVVKAHNIVPFTKYARDNWPHSPEEFYAEAYSLWLTNPAFLQTNYLPIHDFFQNGDYTK
nr:DUF4157 domain-containing protein [Myxococcus sp. CA051A]